MSIDIRRLSPEAQEQIRKQLAERKKEQEARGEIATGPLAPRNDAKGNKLHAEKTADGYASKHEAARAAELRLMEKAGLISDLKEQVKFVLTPAVWEEIPQTGKRGQPIKPKRRCIQREQSYYADFTYHDNKTGEDVVEDAKGYKGGATYRVFKNKAKLMLDKYGIKVVEV